MTDLQPQLENCDDCGVCCQTVSAPPFRIDPLANEPAEKQVTQELLEERLPTWEVRLHVSGVPCMSFDEQTRRCRRYDLRPDACREFGINRPSWHAISTEYHDEIGSNGRTASLTACGFPRNGMDNEGPIR